LSIDPVVTDANTGSSFNRYAYALNNPYKYVDPDGRQERAAEAFGDQFRNDVAAGNAAVYEPFQPVAVGVTGAMVVIPVVVAVGPAAVAVVKNIPVSKIRAVAKIVTELHKLKGDTPNVAKLAENTVKQVVETVKKLTNTLKPQSPGGPPKPPPPPPPPPPPTPTP
jgi:hypothetical protein